MKHTIVPNQITCLMAHNAKRLIAEPVFFHASSPAHRFWAINWKDSEERFEWTVEAPSAGDYFVDVLINGPTGCTVTIASEINRTQIQCTGVWGKIRGAQAISLPAGVSTISISADKPDNEFKSLELIAAADADAIEQRIRAFRVSTEWLKEAQYGLMFQWGQWGFPKTGPAKAWPQQIIDFDVDSFVERMADMSAGYVVWSVSWWSYYVPAPIQAVDEIVSGHTSPRDLIGELADALNARGIKLMLYYHAGGESKDWWSKNWVSPDDKTRLFANWKKVISEIGNRYGSRLAGWFFDDDNITYPANYEELGAAARAGNPDRLISYNSWIGPKGTEFQDLAFGEGCTGDTPVSVDEEGVIVSGNCQGLQAHGMFIMEQDWGVHEENTVITPTVSKEDAVRWAQIAAARKQALTYTLMMYEDGSMHPQTIETMKAVKEALSKECS